MIFIKSMGSSDYKGRRLVNFGCDTPADIASLPTTAAVVLSGSATTPIPAPGSTAEVTSNGDVYELNASSAWVKQTDEYHGTEAQRLALSTTGLANGATFFVYDSSTKLLTKIYKYVTGIGWCEL